MDTERSWLYNRRVICWLRSWPQPSEHFGLEGGLFLMNSLRALAVQEKKLTLMVGVTLPGWDLLSRSLRVLLSPETGGWSCSWCLSSWREGGRGRSFIGLIHSWCCGCCVSVVSGRRTCFAKLPRATQMADAALRQRTLKRTSSSPTHVWPRMINVDLFWVVIFQFLTWLRESPPVRSFCTLTADYCRINSAAFPYF